MMNRHGEHGLSRRAFLGRAAGGMLAGLTLPRIARAQAASEAAAAKPAVALMQGASRADNIFEVLKRIEPQVRAGIARKKRVMIKPNLVNIDNPLTATHAECMEAILEFLAPIFQEEILVAETPANGPAAEGYDNYGYHALEKQYKIKLLDLDFLPFHTEYVVDERHKPVPVRYSSFLCDPDAYVISTAPFKTHDRAIVTLGLKNLTVGGILKDDGFRWGPNSRGRTDKHLVHGGPENQGIHFNLFSLAQKLRPDLSVLDGFQGMEHNGPVSGTPIDSQLAVASTDWLAADRVAAELMGFDYRKIGYMVFAENAGMGVTDVSQLDLLGPAIAEIARPYQPHDDIEKQYGWM